jgi:DNA-binding HxlR family transcriptional regulator
VLKGERPGWREAVEEAMDRIRACLPANDTDAEAEAARLKHLEWMITSQRRFGVERTAPVPSLLVHVGNYWCGGILLILYSGPLRPSSMLKILGLMEPDHKISQRMLTLNLRELERDGLIEREIFASRRAHVEYCLTPLGRALSSIVADRSRDGQRVADRRGPRGVRCQGGRSGPSPPMARQFRSAAAVSRDLTFPLRPVPADRAAPS